MAGTGWLWVGAGPRAGGCEWGKCGEEAGPSERNRRPYAVTCREEGKGAGNGRAGKTADGPVTPARAHFCHPSCLAACALRSSSTPSSIMAAVLPNNPSFVSLSSTHVSTQDSDTVHLSPKVRFEHECVVIPDPAPVSRLPRLVTKSYSLPLWKRKREPSIVSESEDEPSDDHVVFKVSVPRSVPSYLPSTTHHFF